MGFFSIILIVFLSYRNSLKAKLKDQNGVLWGFITCISFLVTEIIGILFVIMFFCRDIVDFNRLAVDPSYKTTATKQLNDAFEQNPMHTVTIYLFGVGGYLIIRYILEKMPGKKQPEVHWMDKIGQDR